MYSIKNTLHNLQLTHMVSDWLEPRTTSKRLTKATLLPPSVMCGQLCVCAADEECALEVVMTWPCLIVSLQIFYRKWLQSDNSDQIENFYPKLVECDRFLKFYRACGTTELESKATNNFLY